jgi:aristolochene synthase
MSLQEGLELYDKLIGIIKGEKEPDRSVGVEYMLADIWAEMRAIDKHLADDMMTPTFIFWRSQVDKTRLTSKTLGEYFKYRELDVASA